MKVITDYGWNKPDLRWLPPPTDLHKHKNSNNSIHFIETELNYGVVVVNP